MDLFKDASSKKPAAHPRGNGTATNQRVPKPASMAKKPRNLLAEADSIGASKKAAQTKVAVATVCIFRACPVDQRVPGAFERTSNTEQKKSLLRGLQLDHENRHRRERAVTPKKKDRFEVKRWFEERLARFRYGYENRPYV